MDLVTQITMQPIAKRDIIMITTSNGSKYASDCSFLKKFATQFYSGTDSISQILRFLCKIK